MSLKLDQAVVMITGASSGIGYEFARQLAPRAQALVLVARRKERLETLKLELLKLNPSLQVSIQPCDLTDISQIDEMLGRVSKEVGDIEVLINNAGIGDFAYYEASDWKKTAQMIDLNVIAPLYLTRRLLGPMVRNRTGGILNVSSIAGIFYFPAFSAYVGTKYFLNGYTESLRAELSGTGVVASQLCPGPVATEFESNAKNGSAVEVPSWLEISAEKCVQYAVAGFERARPLIVPGWMPRVFVAVYSLIPHLIRRPFAQIMSAILRRNRLGLQN